jgi:Sulfotransferase family
MRQSNPERREPRRRQGETTPGGAPLSGLRRVPPVTFVGGTGRSGTHIVAKLLSRHGKLHLIPVECRFHVEEERGFPALLAGTTSKAAFLRRLRGFWWKGFQTNRLRGMYRFVPRERFDSAVDAFDARFDTEPEAACRALFWELLWPAESDGVMSGIVEQSCDTIAQAPTLLRLFPEASFVHVVRDGRDASASRVSQARGLIYPRTRAQGIEWWERRLRAMDAGARAIPAERLCQVSLDELLVDESREILTEIMATVRLNPGRKVRHFLRRRMSAKSANAERWRQGLSRRELERIDSLYVEALDRLDAEGVSAVPLLRRTYERRARERS